ncbi:4-hydroxybenzoate octaprenyltransferase [Acidisoma silvae]|uniref:4-hydroxybenzoate octaprenyltransferase n=1 Tax=Acidisoma silvae TaxID=2802396 RepID=A0A963YS69_9PROT|nr:4-hydroxybenzoate octaprenyltransferase [Acidisoma silvae]MCB8875562.1 4-hydroxybenzoate octaprenyltransferase [Acidisoma silvae]
MTAHTDIERGGWVGKLPTSLVPYVILARLDRPIGAWLLFLPGLWSILLPRAACWSSLRLIILFAIGSVVMRSAGCVVNDMWDRKIDRLVERTAGRPLASGALSMRQALGFLVLLLAIGLAILLSLNHAAQILGVSSLILVALYPAAKRVTWWPQAMLGITFGFGAPLGYVAATGHFSWAALALYAAVFFWILGYDTIYAHQDREDDALVGVRSTARLFAETSVPFLAVCYGLVVVLLLVAGSLAHLSLWFLPVLILPAWMLARQVTGLDVNNAPLCLALFKSNKWVGLAVALSFLAGRI